MKVCGKRSLDGALRNAERPVKTNSGNFCTEGFKACNEEFLTSATLVEYAICIPDSADRDLSCPITAFAFSLDGMD